MVSDPAVDGRGDSGRCSPQELPEEDVMSNMSLDTWADEIVRDESRMVHPCPRCQTSGAVDFFDLVRGVASLHCPSCPTAWTVETEAPYANRNR